MYGYGSYCCSSAWIIVYQYNFMGKQRLFAEIGNDLKAIWFAKERMQYKKNTNYLKCTVFEIV